MTQSEASIGVKAAFRRCKKRHTGKARRRCMRKARKLAAS